MLHARGVESSPSAPPEAEKARGGVAAASAGTPGPAAAGAEPAGAEPTGTPAEQTDLAATTKQRSETYVARRRPAALAAGLRGLAQSAYEARWTLRVISVTAAAAGVAYAVCLPFGDFAPAYGAASALYAVQLTVRTSVLDGARRTLLMGISVLLGVLILKTVGLSAVAVTALVFVSLGVGQLLRLGLRGSLQIPGTAIFILALGSSVTTPELLNRVWATFVGAVIGAAACYLAYPGDPRARARHGLAELAGSIAGLLADMSAGVARRPTAAETEMWLARARAMDDEVERVAPLVDEAGAFLRIDPFSRKSGSAELSQALATLVHSVNQVRGIARTLFDHRVEGAPRLPASLAEVLARTAVAYRAQADALERDGASVDVALEAVRQARQESLRSLRRVDETGAWVVSGAILTDVDRMVRQLEGDTPALGGPSDAPRPRGRLASLRGRRANRG